MKPFSKGDTHILNDSIYRTSIYIKCKPENTSGATRSWRWALVLAPKEHEGILGGDGSVLYFDCSGGYKTMGLSNLTGLYMIKGEFNCT